MMNMPSIPIGRLAGIPIGVQPLWFLIVALITWSLGAFYFPETVPGISPGAAFALGLFSALLLFVSVILHELGHSLEARRHGVDIERIDLWLLGGVARMKGYPKVARHELQFALAGPAVTLVIAVVFGAVALALPEGTPDAVRAVVGYQFLVNAVILVFNMLPAFPLDGGRVVRSLVWWRNDDLRRATSIAVAIGRGFGFAMIGLGLFSLLFGAVAGIWLALIGFFITVAGKAEEDGLRIRTAFEGREAGRFMSFPAVTIPGGTTVERAIEEFFVRHGYTAFPVVEGDQRPVGLIDISHVEQVPHDRRAVTPVRDATLREPELIVDEHKDVAELLQSGPFQESGRAVVKTDRGGLGILSVTDAQRALRAMELMQR